MNFGLGLLLPLGILQRARKSRIHPVGLTCTFAEEHSKKWRYLVVRCHSCWSCPSRLAKCDGLCAKRKSRGKREVLQRGSIQSKRSIQSANLSVKTSNAGGAVAYIYHGEQNVSSSGCFLSTVRRIDQRIDRRAGQYQPASKIPNNGDMVGLSCI